jgi:hypothetical protein
MAITASIVGSTFLTVMLNGRTVTINSDHANYQAIREAMKVKDHDTVEKLINVAKSVINFVHGKVRIDGDKVFYGDMELGGPVVNRIIDMLKENFDAQPMLNFLSNLMDNPSRTAVSELYLFLEASELPITEDGCFLAYKKVDDNYRDFHSGKFDNSIGVVCKEMRNTVDDVRNNVCSRGLHFCSFDYLPQYHGGYGRVMIVKINPRDVVSIPSDYDNAKGRCCEYVVVGEHEGKEDVKAFTSPVYNDAAPVSAPSHPTAMPYKPTLTAMVGNPGLQGYNRGRSDASKDYRVFNDQPVDVNGGAYHSGYAEAYKKGWDSILNTTSDDGDDFRDDLNASTDTDTDTDTDTSTDQNNSYVQGYHDASNGLPYDDENLDGEDYADGWHNGKLDMIS